jgi:hypothetical protein
MDNRARLFSNELAIYNLQVGETIRETQAALKNGKNRKRYFERANSTRTDSVQSTFDGITTKKI